MGSPHTGHFAIAPLLWSNPMVADPAGPLVRADLDGVAAGAVDFLSCKEAGLGFRIPSTGRTFNYKFSHLIFLPYYS